MHRPDTLEADWRELARRRRLAGARRERESERNALLGKLIRTERRAGQLRDWIAARETAIASGADPDLERMLAWARAQLAELDAAIDPVRLSELLRNQNLFPEHDEFADPLGDPPPLRPWGR